MKKSKLYLDTPVISRLEALDAPETLRLWDEIKAGVYDIVVSEYGY
ncbi:MAG: hypothetical protein LBU70_01830 [Chitinispirillales bacterium]|jgi:hypothetical protein|nr:hypothetical protein [Chitinispirillales bacterium]